MSNVNISPQNVQGKCDNKCVYEYKYPTTNLVATNIGSLIMLKGDTSPPSAVFNGEKYDVNCIFIASPSVHLFNNSTTDAEILIEHECVTGGPKLIVCVPIKNSSNTSDATSLLTDIINNVVSNAPSSGETTNVNMSDFTLNTIVPQKPFYSYAGSDMEGTNANFIVYGLINAIPLGNDILTSLSNIIKANSITTTTDTGLFYTSFGPGKKNTSGIYIKCKPTGSSGETTVTTASNNDSSDSIWNNPTGKLILEIIMGVIMFLVLFAVINYAYTMATANPTKLVKTHIAKK